MFQKLMVILALFTALNSRGIAMATEELKYIVESKTSNFEIRKYGPTLVAETSVSANFEDAGNQAFKILAGYIFGNNKSKTKIAAMSAPVSQMAVSEKIAMTVPVTLVLGLKNGIKKN